MTATTCGGGSVLSKGSVNPTGCTTNHNTIEMLEWTWFLSDGLEIHGGNFWRRHPGHVVLLDAARKRAARPRGSSCAHAADCLIQHRHREGSESPAGQAETRGALHRSAAQSVPLQRTSRADASDNGRRQ